MVLSHWCYNIQNCCKIQQCMKMSLLGMNEAAHLKMKISPNLSKGVKKNFK